VTSPLRASLTELEGVIALVGGIVALSIWIAGGARLQRAGIEPWLEGNGPAIGSPPLGGHC
jgi:hypothetical protein